VSQSFKSRFSDRSVRARPIAADEKKAQEITNLARGRRRFGVEIEIEKRLEDIPAFLRAGPVARWTNPLDPPLGIRDSGHRVT